MKIEAIWNDKSHLLFLGKIKKVIKSYKEFCIKKAKERRMEKELARKSIQKLCLLSKAMFVIERPKRISPSNLTSLKNLRGRKSKVNNSGANLNGCR